ncbi:MAG: hypothetical protein B7Y45_14415 [Sphingomonas sp. 28-66-16]|nr:MAG: hypothetical protein B7Y45_14415 [Sphingomonas sp. 28-66-16]
MIEFIAERRSVIFTYQSEFRANGWIWQELKKSSGARVSQVFRFQKQDLLEEPGDGDQDHFDSFVFRFRLATPEPHYHRIAGRKLRIDRDVLIAKEGIEWTRKLFAAERNVSIFRRIDKIVTPGQEIAIGGPRPDAIPIPVFLEMIKKFPNSTELDLFPVSTNGTDLRL